MLGAGLRTRKKKKGAEDGEEQGSAVFDCIEGKHQKQ